MCSRFKAANYKLWPHIHMDITAIYAAVMSKRTARHPQGKPGTDVQDAERRRQQRGPERCIKDR